VARAYLAIEAMRLGTRLSVEEGVDDARARAVCLPSSCSPGRERDPARHRHPPRRRRLAHRGPHGRAAHAHQRGEPVRSGRAAAAGSGSRAGQRAPAPARGYGDRARVEAERGAESFRVAISMPAEAVE
jgi:hypothetical protein